VDQRAHAQTEFLLCADDGMSNEDREAKALLNKFLGATVLMQGIEPLLQAQSPGLVSQVEKQRLAIALVSTSSQFIYFYQWKKIVLIIYVKRKISLTNGFVYFLS